MMGRALATFAALAILTLAGSAVSACTSTDPDDKPAPVTTTVAAAQAPVTDTSTAPKPETTTPNDDSSEQTSPPVPEQPGSVSAPPASATVPAVPSRDDVNVDARTFERGDGQYFFTTPSGNVFCAFRSINAPGTDIGCQVRSSVPGNTGRECLNAENNTYAVQILTRGTVEQICTNQGIFVTDSAPVLEYGQVIGVQSDICRSTDTGVSCYSRTGSGFMISREVNIAF